MKRKVIRGDLRPTVLLIFGGMGREHVVSVAGADFVLSLMDRRRMRPVPVLITEGGEWLISVGDRPVPSEMDRAARLCENAAAAPPSHRKFGKKRANPAPKTQHGSHLESKYGVSDLLPVSPAVRGVGGLKTPRGFIAARCAIPLLHGDFGEDGTIAGALRSAAIPFVGCDVTASALAADKICTKMIAERLGIPTARWCFGTAESRDATVARAESELGFPMIVKPARLGSSIGISRVTDHRELIEAYSLAASLDSRILIEEDADVECELECGFVGIKCKELFTKIGEIRTRVGLYDFESKYSEGSSAEVIYPSRLDEAFGEHIRDASRRLCRAIGITQLSRIDFFLTTDGRLLFNEINTMPGFTATSLFPRLLESVGLTPSGLIGELVGERLL